MKIGKEAGLDSSSSNYNLGKKSNRVPLIDVLKAVTEAPKGSRPSRLLAATRKLLIADRDDRTFLTVGALKMLSNLLPSLRHLGVSSLADMGGLSYHKCVSGKAPNHSINGAIIGSATFSSD